MTARCTLALVALLWAAPALQAGEVIQLPTFGFTTVNTTVTAPDGGTVLLGGIDRVAEGSTERGVPILGKVPGLNRLFKNRGIGRSMSASNMTVIPRIIILEEEEERQVGRVLAERRAFAEAPPPPPFAVSDLYQRRAAFLAEHVASQQPADHRHETAPSANAAVAEAFDAVEAVRQKNEQAAAQRDREAVVYFERGQKAEAEGNYAAARVNYANASRRATGEFKDEILARLEAVQNK